MKKLFIVLLAIAFLTIFVVPSIAVVESHRHTDYDVGYVSRQKGRKMAKRISVQRAKIDTLTSRIRELEDFADFTAYVIFNQHSDLF